MIWVKLAQSPSALERRIYRSKTVLLLQRISPDDAGARQIAVDHADGLDRAILVARAVFWTEKLILTPLYYYPLIG
jgi:hypothetical protein